MISVGEEHTNWVGIVEENMVRYIGNDDPTAAEGFNGLGTKDKYKRQQKPHMGTQNTHEKQWEV